MHYGVYFSSVGVFSDVNLLVDLAREAEDLGWEGVFIWDHIGNPHAAVDPWVALTAIALNTKSVKLGALITPVARRRPWKLARETMSLDHVSNGRLIFGAGLGWSKAEFDTFGEDGDPRIRAEKLDEGLEILSGLWSGESYSFDGKHYHIKDAHFLPRPLQTPRIPIWICGAWSDKKAPIRRAARWDGAIAVSADESRAITPAEIREVKQYMQEQRTTKDPFDIVVILWSDGDRSVLELENFAKYQESGVTWWLEDLSLIRCSSVEETRARLRKGPPRN